MRLTLLILLWWISRKTVKKLLTKKCAEWYRDPEPNISLAIDEKIYFIVYEIYPDERFLGLRM